MRGRARGHQQRIIVLAHQIEAMAREQRLRPVDHYLRPTKRKGSDDAGVLAMFRQMKKQGANVKIRRVKREPSRSAA